MKKFQYISDLHLETECNREIYFSKYQVQPKSDLLIICGDVVQLDKEGSPIDYGNFFDWCSKNYKETYLCFGNHELYNSFDLSHLYPSCQIDVKPNVHYMNNKSVVIDDTEFFFTILWSEADLIFNEEMKKKNNFKLIHYNDKVFTPNDHNKLYIQCLEWLDKAINESKAKYKVVVSHYCPLYALILEQYRTSPYLTLFYANADDFTLNHTEINYWIYGHTHDNVEDLKFGKTVFACNQFGEPEESDSTFSSTKTSDDIKQ